MKKILIIGGSGFLGSHVADILSEKKYKVTIYDKKKSQFLKSSQKMIISDLKNNKNLDKAIKNSDIIYHFAAMSDIGDCMYKPLESAQANIIFTLKVLELCKKYKIKRFIFASTIYIHSSQGGFYRITKQASEQYIEEYNKKFSIKYTILRFGTIYGLRSNNKNNLTNIVNTATKKKLLKYSGGTSRAVRRYINVLDAARACYQVLNKKFENKTVLITGKQKIKITTVMNILSKLLKFKSKPKFEKKTEYGHYDVTPYNYKKSQEIKLYPEKPLSLKNGLIELIENYK